MRQQSDFYEFFRCSYAFILYEDEKQAAMVTKNAGHYNIKGQSLGVAYYRG
jgi:hypothetical protein